MKSEHIFVHPFYGLGEPETESVNSVTNPMRGGPAGSKSRLLPVERYDHRQGLKSLQIHISLCSVDGRIWSAMPAGLACYDGVNINMYGRQHGLSSHGLRTIAVHPDNTLWLGTDIGVEVLDISGPAPVVLWSDNIGTVNSIDIDVDHAVVGTSRGLFIWRGGEKLARSKTAGLSQAIIKSVLFDHAGHAWIAGPRLGLVVLAQDGTTIEIEDTSNLIGPPTYIALITGSGGKDDQIIVGGMSGVAVLDARGKCVTNFHSDSPVGAILFHDNLVWVGAGNALYRLRLENGTLTAHDTVHNNVVVHHMMVDSFDNIWISTGDQALLCLSNMRNTFEQSYDYDVGPVMCIRAGSQGLLVGGANGLMLESGQLTLNWITVWDSIVDDYGKIWSATENGLYCMVNPNFTIPYRHGECDVIAAPCRALAFYNKELYVASISGLARIGANGVTEILDPDGQSLGYVYSLHIGPSGHLWIATLGRGLFRMSSGELSSVDVKTMADNSNVYALTHDGRGHIYVAHDNIISKIDPKGTARVLVEAEAAIAAWSLKYLDIDRLVAGTSYGLIIYDPDTGGVRRKLSGNFDDVPWEFTTSRSLEIIDGSTIYCGLGTGLRTVDFKSLMRIERQAVPALAKATWRGVTPIMVNNIPTVAPGNWHLQIDLRTGWYLDKCTMQTRLRGFEDAWSPPEPVGPIKYTSLPPGTYTLEVEIRSPIAGAGPITEVFSFDVESEKPDDS